MLKLDTQGALQSGACNCWAGVSTIGAQRIAGHGLQQSFFLLFLLLPALHFLAEGLSF